MKKLLALTIATIILLSNCKKSNDDNTSAVCDGLINDTQGTNDNGRIYMPTAFTPNGDGLNDNIRPILVDISAVTFEIYDDQNNVVFSTNQLYQGWDVATGINTSIKYSYRIQAVTASNRHIGECGELYRLTCLPSNILVTSLRFEDQIGQNGFTFPTSDILPTCP